jgi:hypothetical protein
MRSELESTFPSIVKLVADQAPLTGAELEHVRQVTLARFQVSGPGPVRSSGGDGRGWFSRWFNRDKSQFNRPHAKEKGKMTKPDVVRSAYAPRDFWSKVAKRSCRRLLGLRPRLNWCRTVKQFLREFAEVEDSHGYILESTGELATEFLARLVCRLGRMGELSETEQSAMLASLRREAPVPVIGGQLAQALILKACLEIGRPRTRERMFGCSRLELYIHVRTVDEILSTKLENPLPNPQRSDSVPFLFTPEVLNRIRSTPEHHLVWAYDHDYRNAVKAVSLAYDTLDDAFREISMKTSPPELEKRFALKYKQMAKWIW